MLIQFNGVIALVAGVGHGFNGHYFAFVNGDGLVFEGGLVAVYSQYPTAKQEAIDGVSFRHKKFSAGIGCRAILLCNG